MLADFTPDSLEYFVVEYGKHSEPNDAGFEVIEAMLAYYAENHEQLQIRFENNRTLSTARRAYIEQNPPKARDVIINYRLFDPNTVSKEKKP